MKHRFWVDFFMDLLLWVIVELAVLGFCIRVVSML